MGKMEKNRARKLVAFYTKPDKDNNYTLFVDPKTKLLFKADTKNINQAIITFFIIIGYLIIEFFPIHIIPFDNIMAYLGIIGTVMLLSALFGYYISPNVMGNYRRVYLTTDEWQGYLKRFNK